MSDVARRCIFPLEIAIKFDRFWDFFLREKKLYWRIEWHVVRTNQIAALGYVSRTNQIAAVGYIFFGTQHLSVNTTIKLIP